MIRSFSGSHPYRPQCVVKVAGLAAAEHVTAAIDAGECPRCSRPLPTEHAGAGSRATCCRCVPVCGACGDHEGFAGAFIERWPVSAEAVDEHLRIIGARCRPAFVSLGAHGEPVVILEDGAAPITMRPNPGGRVEYGYDATADTHEVSR